MNDHGLAVDQRDREAGGSKLPGILSRAAKSSQHWWFIERRLENEMPCLFPSANLVALEVKEMPETYRNCLVTPSDKRDLRVVKSFCEVAIDHAYSEVGRGQNSSSGLSPACG